MKATAYGIADFNVLTDPALSIQARGVYCYFCCYADKTQTAYPSRQRILEELGLSKNGYYRHYKQLENTGIVRVERSKCQVNRYHIKTGRSIARSRYGFVYKTVMIDPAITLTAKVLFVYLTAYCPTGKTWKFKKSQVVKEVGLSLYKLNRSMRELLEHKLIEMTETRFSYEIKCASLSTKTEEIQHEKKGHDTSKNEDAEYEKRGHDTSKNEDTEYEKRGHTSSKNEDREQSIIYQSNYQSCLNIKTDEQNDPKYQNMSQEKLLDLISSDIPQKDCKKHNVFFFVVALLNLAKNTQKELNRLLVKNDLKLSSFAYCFLLRYEMKTSDNRHLKNPIAYMKSCLIEFVHNFEFLKDEISSKAYSCKRYDGTYDIAEYESYSVCDGFMD